MTSTDEATPPLYGQPPTRGERTRTRVAVWTAIWAIGITLGIIALCTIGPAGAVAFTVALPAAACLIDGTRN